MYVKVIK